MPERLKKAFPRPEGEAERATVTGAAESRENALQIAVAALDKKAFDIEIIDVVGRVDYADYLVLASGSSDRHVAAIARGVEAAMAERGVRAIAVEGLPVGQWVLIDFVDVVIHVFQEEWRSIYNLGGLWMDAPRVALPAPRLPDA